MKFFTLSIGNLSSSALRFWRRFSPGLRSSERTGLGSSGFDEPEGFEGFDEPEGLEGIDNGSFEVFDETASFEVSMKLADTNAETSNK
ncbi:hypothetical protein CTI12_AA260610 [Artemisia annua]|uniref:Uncharacterized protein n=1 Tax=Artemisia annua TaxID=35608 RepID=A0A2U1NJ64_ARTAN|nr:hypothetical protein CTI12_AA260610 [Artemisia annua]